MNNKNLRALKFLGLATNAGFVVTGGETCMRMLRSGKIKLLVLSVDACLNTRDKFQRACRVHKVKCIGIGDRYDIGRYTGKGTRTVAGITDENFSKRLFELATGVD